MRQRILEVALAAGFICACGGASTPPPQPAQPAQSAGGELVLPEEEPEPAAAPAAEVSGPATLTVVAKVGHDVVPARIKVFDASGAPVAEGASGKPLSVRSGDLQIEATLADSKVLLGHETVHRSVSVAPKADATESVVFERCLVRVAVNIRGKLDTTAVVTLSKDGSQVAKLTSGAKDYVAIAPGRYSASVRSKRAEITSSDITLNEGATQTVPIDVN